MQKQVRFIATGCNTVTGNFATGDIARVDDRLAEHLVADAKVATYVTPLPKTEPVPVAPVKHRKSKNDSDA